MGWEKDSEYFSGQGVVLVGLRGKDGRPRGLRPVGNVSALSIATAINYLEHKESQSGNRSTDRKKVSDTNVTYSATWEDFSSENLELLLRAERTEIAAGQVTDLAVIGRAGLVTPLDHVSISDVTVKVGSEALTAYVDETTAYDYIVNEVGGSIQLNAASQKVGTAVTAITVGATTTVTLASAAGFVAGDKITLVGLTGDDADALNGLEAKVVSVAGANVVINVDTSNKTITATSAKALGGDVELLVSYTYQDQSRLEALTAPEAEVFMRFEGLNTAEGNIPVVIDIFKVSVTPLQELSLISDEFQASQVDGTVLADTNRKTGSKYYTVRKANK